GGSSSASATVSVNQNVGCSTSNTGWQNTGFSAQSGTFTATFNTTPSAQGIDAQTGFSNGPASTYANLAAIVSFDPNGTFKVRNGGAYQSDIAMSYVAGQTYKIRMVINVAGHTYDVYVTPTGGAETKIASNYAFRTEQAGATQLNSWAVTAPV